MVTLHSSLSLHEKFEIWSYKTLKSYSTKSKYLSVIKHISYLPLWESRSFPFSLCCYSCLSSNWWLLSYSSQNPLFLHPNWTLMYCSSTCYSYSVKTVFELLSFIVLWVELLLMERSTNDSCNAHSYHTNIEYYYE